MSALRSWQDFASLVSDTASDRRPRGPAWFCDGPPGGEHPLKRWPLDAACSVCGMTRKASRGEEEYSPARHSDAS